MTGLALAIAMALDARLGEPKWLWDRAPHPAVLMGRAIDWCERRLNHGTNRRRNGTLMLGGLCLAAWLLGHVITALPFGWLWSALVAAILLAQRSLVDHIHDVGAALERGLPEARESVARIVGRDVCAMTEPQIARAAIESGAENFSDGIIAPAFWFLVAGLPGMLVYKVINTADSMVGYRTARFERFGWASARVDDVVNWIPARVSAALILLSQARPDLWRVLWRDAGQHRSPNAGWPEAAMAGVLGVALSGPRSYDGAVRDFPFVFAEGARDIGAAEIAACCAVLWRAWTLALGLVLVMWVMF